MALGMTGHQDLERIRGQTGRISHGSCRQISTDAFQMLLGVTKEGGVCQRRGSASITTLATPLEKQIEAQLGQKSNAKTQVDPNSEHTPTPPRRYAFRFYQPTKKVYLSTSSYTRWESCLLLSSSTTHISACPATEFLAADGPVSPVYPLIPLPSYVALNPKQLTSVLNHRG